MADEKTLKQRWLDHTNAPHDNIRAKLIEATSQHLGWEEGAVMLIDEAIMPVINEEHKIAKQQPDKTESDCLPNCSKHRTCREQQPDAEMHIRNSLTAIVEISSDKKIIELAEMARAYLDVIEYRSLAKQQPDDVVGDRKEFEAEFKKTAPGANFGWVGGYGYANDSVRSAYEGWRASASLPMADRELHEIIAKMLCSYPYDYYVNDKGDTVYNWMSMMGTARLVLYRLGYTLTEE